MAPAAGRNRLFNSDAVAMSGKNLIKINKETRRRAGEAILPLAAGLATWEIVIAYSGESEAWDAQAPFWTTSLITALLLGLARPRQSDQMESLRPALQKGAIFSGPLSPALQTGALFAGGQFLGAILGIREPPTLIAAGFFYQALSAVAFSGVVYIGMRLRARLISSRKRGK